MANQRKSQSKKTRQKAGRKTASATGYHFGRLKRVKISSIAVYASKPQGPGRGLFL